MLALSESEQTKGPIGRGAGSLDAIFTQNIDNTSRPGFQGGSVESDRKLGASCCPDLWFAPRFGPDKGICGIYAKQGAECDWVYQRDFLSKAVHEAFRRPPC